MHIFLKIPMHVFLPVSECSIIFKDMHYFKLDCTPGVRQIRLGQSDRGYGF